MTLRVLEDATEEDPEEGTSVEKEALDAYELRDTLFELVTETPPLLLLLVDNDEELEPTLLEEAGVE